MFSMVQSSTCCQRVLRTHDGKTWGLPQEAYTDELYYNRDTLKKLGVDVVFVRYPREGHGIREPNHVIDLMNRQLEWFDSHLGIKRPKAKKATTSG